MEVDYKKLRAEFKEFINSRNDISFDELYKALELKAEDKARYFFDKYFPTPGKIKRAAKPEQRLKTARILYSLYGIPSRFFLVPESEIKTDWNTNTLLLSRIFCEDYSEEVYPINHEDLDVIYDDSDPFKEEENNVNIVVASFDSSYGGRYIPEFIKYINETENTIWSNWILHSNQYTSEEEAQKWQSLDYHYWLQSHALKSIERRFKELKYQDKTPFYVINLVLPGYDPNKTSLNDIIDACPTPLLAHILNCILNFSIAVYVTNTGMNYNVTIIDDKYTITGLTQYQGSSNGNYFLIPESFLIERFHNKKVVSRHTNAIYAHMNHMNSRHLISYMKPEKIMSAINFFGNIENKNYFQRVEKFSVLIQYVMFDLLSIWTANSKTAVEDLENWFKYPLFDQGDV